MKARSPTQTVTLAMLLALLVAGCTHTAPTAAPAPPPAEPMPLITSRDWQEMPDFLALRLQYGERDDFFEICEAQQAEYRKAAEMLQTGRWNALIAFTDPLLEQCPIDIDLHMLKLIALNNSGREAEATVHARWHRGLVESVLGSGDGQTPGTAWVVVSVAEEYAILRALGANVESQSLVEGRIDAMTVTLEGGSTTLYFNPELHFRRLERQMTP